MLKCSQTEPGLPDEEWKDYATSLWEFFTDNPRGLRTHMDTVRQAHVAREINDRRRTPKNWGFVHDSALWRRLQS